MISETTTAPTNLHAKEVRKETEEPNGSRMAELLRRFWWNSLNILNKCEQHILRCLTIYWTECWEGKPDV